ncbi:MAG: hypothetical protein ABI921_02735 [Panacibacter sp.]
MKKLGLLLLTIFTLTSVFGQTDKNDNPIFNSDLISEEKFDNFELTSSYYNIRENISNKKSSVAFVGVVSNKNISKQKLPHYPFQSSLQ